MKSESRRRKQISTNNKDIYTFSYISHKDKMLQKHKKMQKQSESLVGMLVSYKAGQGRNQAHTLLPAEKAEVLLDLSDSPRRAHIASKKMKSICKFSNDFPRFDE